MHNLYKRNLELTISSNQLGLDAAALSNKEGELGIRLFQFTIRAVDEVPANSPGLEHRSCLKLERKQQKLAWCLEYLAP